MLMLVWLNLLNQAVIAVKPSHHCCNARTSDVHTTSLCKLSRHSTYFFLSLYFKTTQHEALHREVSDLITEFSVITTDSDLDSFRQRVQTVVSCNVSYQSFKEFMEVYGSLWSVSKSIVLPFNACSLLVYIVNQW